MVNKFWFVWNPNKLVPKYKHGTLEEAKHEAERLANLNPGQMFHVLEWRGSCIKNSVNWQVDNDGSIPF